jgi:hypothetical protein
MNSVLVKYSLLAIVNMLEIRFITVVLLLFLLYFDYLRLRKNIYLYTD